MVIEKCGIDEFSNAENPFSKIFNSDPDSDENNN